MQQTFGVDIGNSGFRVAELHVQRGELGEMFRIDWCPADLNTKECEGGSSSRYLPNDPRWLRELDRYIETFERPNSHLPPRWLVSSVRRDALRLLHDHLLDSLQSTHPTSAVATTQHATQKVNSLRRVEVVTCDTLPLDVRVDSPQAVGIDRLLAALAALELTALRPAVVIQAGSAVTVDLITQPSGNAAQPIAEGKNPAASVEGLVASKPISLGSFEGGAILPGVPMMLRLLGKGADMLPEIDAGELLQLPPLPGKNTEAAMMCGAASALVGGVLHLVGRYRHQYGAAIPIIISGGDGMLLSPYVPAPVLVKDHLVHRGLMRLARDAIVT